MLEECDDGNQLDTDYCLNDCTIPLRGDGIIQADEQCDLGEDNRDDFNAYCPYATTCILCNYDCETASISRYFGDGLLDEEEECDDANRTNGDGCDNSCVLEL